MCVRHIINPSLQASLDLRLRNEAVREVIESEKIYVSRLQLCIQVLTHTYTHTLTSSSPTAFPAAVGGCRVHWEASVEG